MDSSAELKELNKEDEKRPVHLGESRHIREWMLCV